MQGLARKAWERLRLHQVNLIALQRRRDPEQVLLQCLPRRKVGVAPRGLEGPSRVGRGLHGGAGHQAPSSGCSTPAPQVDATLQRLLDRYRGPEPSDTVEMFEGEKFFAAFEKGIDVDAGMLPPPRGDAGVLSPGSLLSPSRPPDRPDCVEGRICFVFYSHLKNLKEVYVTTALDRRAQAVRGQVGQRPRMPLAARQGQNAEPTSPQRQVSFYRGAVSEEVPEEAAAARQRKGADSLWMATLPIKLPVWPGGGGQRG